LSYRTEAASGIVVVLTLILGKQFYQGENHRLTMLYWAIWLIFACAITINLVTTNIELIHFLQYGTLSYLLALAIDPERRKWPLITLMLLTLALGVIDELNQYFFLTPGNSAHIDFNDFLLNLQGAAGGMLIFYGFRFPHDRLASNEAHWKYEPWFLGVSVLYLASAVIILTLLWSETLVYAPSHTIPPGGIEYSEGLLRVYLQREPGLLGSWNTSFSGGQYYVLSAAEGFFFLVTATIIYSSYGLLSYKLSLKVKN
jgi:hypothetical protein